MSYLIENEDRSYLIENDVLTSSSLMPKIILDNIIKTDRNKSCHARGAFAEISTALCRRPSTPEPDNTGVGRQLFLHINALPS